MSAYYNEHDPFAAAWLRELIADGLIAPGEVDERDIQDVTPDELRPFRQHHLFAGIGIWSAALRGAGWEDDRPVLTVSCPCQPFSQAGEGKGFADERHLWPAAFHLIGELGPAVVLGEQVASPDGHAWLDLVSADMEAASYTGAAFDLCSAGFGAPNIRQRLYFVWMADSGSRGLRRRHQHQEHPRASIALSGEAWEQRLRTDGGADGSTGGLAHADRAGPPSEPGDAGEVRGLPETERQSGHGAAVPRGSGGPSRMADADGGNAGAERLQRGGEHGQRTQDGSAGGVADTSSGGLAIVGRADQPRRSGHADGGEPLGRPGPVNGLWRDADWIFCTDERWRPVAPGSFPLAAGNIPNRLAALRGSGNALNKEVAQGFVTEVMEVVAARERSEAA